MNRLSMQSQTMHSVVLRSCAMRCKAVIAVLLVLFPLALYAEGGRTPLRVENGIVTSASRIGSGC